MEAEADAEEVEEGSVSAASPWASAPLLHAACPPPSPWPLISAARFSELSARSHFFAISRSSPALATAALLSTTKLWFGRGVCGRGYMGWLVWLEWCYP